MSKHHHLFLIPVVTMLSMLGPFSIDTYLPAFPDMEADFGVSTAAMSQTLGGYLIAFAISTLAWGPLLDRFGRKSSTVVSLLGFALTSAGCALSTDFGTLLVFRILQGVFASGSMITGRAMISDEYKGPDAQRAMAKVMFIFALAPAIAPIIGGWLDHVWGWQSIFWFLAIISTALAGLTYYTIRETLVPEHKQSLHPAAITKTYGRALAHVYFMMLLLTLSLAFGGLFIYIAGASQVIFVFLNLQGTDFGIQFVPMVAGLMIGSWAVGKLAGKCSTNAMISIGFAVLALAALLNLAQVYLFSPTPFTVIAPLTVYAFGVALTMPGLSLLALDCFPMNRGMASSLQSFLHMGANALVASVLIPLILSQLQWFVLSQLALLIAAAITWLIALKFTGENLPARQA